MKAAVIMMIFGFIAWLSAGSFIEEYLENQIDSRKVEHLENPIAETKAYVRQIEIQKLKFALHKTILDQEKANKFDQIEQRKQKFKDFDKKLKSRDQENKEYEHEKEQHQQQRYFDPQHLARKLIKDLDREKTSIDQEIAKEKQSLENKISKLDDDKRQFEEKIEALQKILDNENLKPHNTTEKLFQQKEHEKSKPKVNFFEQKDDEKLKPNYKKEKHFQEKDDAKKKSEKRNQLLEEQNKIIERFVNMTRGIEDIQMLQKFETSFPTFK
jgi:hypothetical protein